VSPQTANRSDRERSRPRTAWSRLPVLALLLILSAGLVSLLRGGREERDPARAAGVVRVESGAGVVREARVDELRRLSAAQLSDWLRRVPTTRRERRGAAIVTLRVERAALRRKTVAAIRAGGGTVTVPELAVASSARLPIFKQALRNNCETAALSMLLAARGVKARQLELQAQLARSGPLDPRVDGSSELPVWGDPDEGFVGRPDGGGTSGGYGVYERPVQALGRRRGVSLTRFSGRPPEALYRRLASGRPIMVWVGLSEGPYRSWRTPSGRRVTGNFGEHTVVLTGIRGDQIAVNDPIDGRIKVWTRSYFEFLWRRLGRRALSL
jgi:uncharacterized protein YvpB